MHVLLRFLHKITCVHCCCMRVQCFRITYDISRGVCTRGCMFSHTHMCFSWLVHVVQDFGINKIQMFLWNIHRYVYIYCQCSVAAKGRWSVAVQSMVLGRSPGHHNQTVNSFMTLFLPSTEPPPCSPGRSVFEVVMSVNDVMFLFLNDFGPPLLMAY